MRNVEFGIDADGTMIKCLGILGLRGHRGDILNTSTDVLTSMCIYDMYMSKRLDSVYTAVSWPWVVHAHMYM